MVSPLEALRLRMEAAAEAQDFEEAARLRDQYGLLRGQPGAEVPAEMDTSRLHRQQPGRMGLGTSEQAVTPPPGWKPPPRPDPMTASTRPAKRRRR
jgi:hypothetical protein